MEQGFRVTGCAAYALILVYIAFWAAVIFVALHFIGKLW